MAPGVTGGESHQLKHSFGGLVLTWGSSKEAVDYLVDYESIDGSHLPLFDESGIWDEAMLADADLRLQFRQALRKAYREGEVYGRKP